MYMVSQKLWFFTFQNLGCKCLKQSHLCECEMNTVLIQTVYNPELSTHKIHNFFVIKNQISTAKGKEKVTFRGRPPVSFLWPPWGSAIVPTDSKMYDHVLGNILESSKWSSQALSLGLVKLWQLQATNPSKCWYPLTKCMTLNPRRPQSPNRTS